MPILAGRHNGETPEVNRKLYNYSLGVSMVMRYSYSAAWSVIGGISLRNDSQPIELCCSKNSRFLLTRDPDSLLANIDRGFALGRLMLKGLVGQQGTAEFPIALEAEIEEIKARRKKKTGAQAVLVVEAHGEIDATIK